MPGTDLLVAAVASLLLAAVALGVFLLLRRAAPSPAGRLLDAGRFAAALEAAGTGEGAGRDELYSAAVAAKHLLELERAADLLDRLLAAEPDDGEALLERGLVAAYRGRLAAAEEYFRGAGARRADLAEPLTLHRAWLALVGGDPDRARRLFEEIEVSLEGKLRDEGGGEPLFAEWFLQAAALWRAAGDAERAGWAARLGRRAAPESRLAARLAGQAATPSAGSR